MVQLGNGRVNGVQLVNLTKRRERILKELSAVEQRIASVGGKGYRVDSGQKRRFKRAKNNRPLHQVVIEILARRKSGVALDPLSRQVLKTGYNTTSSDFKNVLRQCLYHSPLIVHQPESGRYFLKERA